MKNIFVLFCSLCMVFLLTGCDSLDYRKAIGEQEAGNYSSAIDIFSKLGEYKDSEERSRQCNYMLAQQEMSQGNYAEAMEIFENLGDYDDSISIQKQCAFDYGKALFDACDFANAREQFKKADQTEEVEKYLRVSAWEMLRTYVENSGPITKKDESTELIDSKKEVEDYTLTSRQGILTILAEKSDKSHRTSYGFYLRIENSINTTFSYDVKSDHMELKSEFVHKQENNVGASQASDYYKGSATWNIHDFYSEGDAKAFVQDVDGELQYDYLLLQQTGTVVFLQEELPKTGLGITIKDLGFVNF